MADDTLTPAITILRGDQNLYEAHVWANALRVVCDAAAVRAENDAEMQDLIDRAERYMAELRERRS